MYSHHLQQANRNYQNNYVDIAKNVMMSCHILELQAIYKFSLEYENQ